MTREKVISSLSSELVTLLKGGANPEVVCRQYIQMALVVGREHFNDQMNEIIAYDLNGNEVNRFKGVRDAGRQLKLDHAGIRRVIRGDRHSYNGYIFRKDPELLIAKKTA